jgi:adenosyl cobinamide kinase/adenosyl cobinamide phosphate guanylyltransferase
MPLTLLLGGARSGKSRMAIELVAATGKPVVVVATGEARDAEMAERIARHRAERPREWTTVEEPLDIQGAMSSAADDSCVVIDCLTLWVSNLMEQEVSDDEIVALAGSTSEHVVTHPGLVVAVTNEVGSGVIPDNPLGRRFIDLLGRVNAIWAAGAEQTKFVIAGKVLDLR